MSDPLQPHIRLAPGHISPWVLTCGDPDRALQISRELTDVRELAWNREYRSFRGTFEGQDLTVISHGVGASGACICFHELVEVGARVIVRVGTCGSLQEDLGQGDLIVANGGVRDEGTSERMIHLAFPAVADAEVMLALEGAARKLGHPVRRGIMVSTDLFYSLVLPSRLLDYSRAGALGVEMEASALFVMATIRGIRAGAIAAIDGNPLKPRDVDYDPHGSKVAEGKRRMIQVALHGVADLARAGIR